MLNSRMNRPFGYGAIRDTCPSADRRCHRSESCACFSPPPHGTYIQYVHLVPSTQYAKIPPSVKHAIAGQMASQATPMNPPGVGASSVNAPGIPIRRDSQAHTPTLQLLARRSLSLRNRVRWLTPDGPVQSPTPWPRTCYQSPDRVHTAIFRARRQKHLGTRLYGEEHFEPRIWTILNKLPFHPRSILCIMIHIGKTMVKFRLAPLREGLGLDVLPKVVHRD